MPKIKPLTLLCFLIGCASGGGGGGSGPSSSFTLPSANSFANRSSVVDLDWNVAQSEVDVYRTTEYNEQWGLEAIHAAEAYAVLDKNEKNIAGDGVKIAIIDSGVFSSHPDLSANISSTNNHNYVSNNSDISDDYGHGSIVASVAAGVKNNIGMQGVAYNSEIVVLKNLNDKGVGDFLYGISAINAAAVINNVKVINGSWGNKVEYTSYDGVSESGANTSEKSTIGALNVAKNHDVLMVFSAGNDGDNYQNGQISGAESSYLSYPKPTKPALFANNTDLAGYILAVGAVDSDGRIADFSNKCGVAKNYCLVAPGVDVIGAYYKTIGGSYYISEGSGTSFAAPFVSGAAAVLRAAWPTLTAAQTSQILLDSATDFGDVGIDEVYGRGMLNLYAAMQAKGAGIIVSGTSLGAEGYSPLSSTIFSSTIFGDAFVDNVAPVLQNAVFFDDYGRDYKALLDKKISINNSPSILSSSFNVANNYETKILPLHFSFSNNLFYSFWKEKFLTSSVFQKEKSLAPSPFQGEGGGEGSGLIKSLDIKFFLNSYSKNYSKYFIKDNSLEDKNLTANNGFSFVSQLTKNFELGFSFNNNQNDDTKDQNFSFLRFSSLAENPYQQVLSVNSSLQNNSLQNNKNYNQFFVSKTIFDQKLKLNFSYQDSYQSNKINVLDKSRDNQIVDFTLKFLPNEKNNFYFSFGKLDEFNNNILNTKTSGAFESGGSPTTNYFKISLNKKIFSNLNFIANFAEGKTDISGNSQGIFRNFQNVRSKSQAFGFVIDDFFAGKLGLIYNEPMRIYKGKVDINIPVGFNQDGSIKRYEDRVSLVPNGKERDFEIFYTKNLQNFSSVKFNFIAIKDFANVKKSNNDYAGFLNYLMKF